VKVLDIHIPINYDLLVDSLLQKLSDFGCDDLDILLSRMEIYDKNDSNFSNRNFSPSTRILACTGY
jgi:hypothetical protein